MKIVWVIIGSIIGAGFASGKEIYVFFMQYKKAGVMGLFISAFLMMFVLYKSFKLIKKEDINSYHDFLHFLLKRKKENGYIDDILNAMIIIFLIISFYIMVSGFCAFFKEKMNIPIWICGSIMAILCYLSFQKKTNGLIKINSFLVPLLIIVIVILGIKNFPGMINGYSNLILQDTNIFSVEAIFKSILYASYNTILLIPVLVTLKEEINKKVRITKTAVISAVILLILSIIIFGLLFNIENPNEYEMPAVVSVSVNGTVYQYIYSLIIIMAIFTSVVADGYGILDNISKTQKGYKITVLFLCLGCTIIPYIGFSNLVEVLYPILGVLGLIQVILLARK